MDNYNYPMGSDTPDAPWNKDTPKIEVKATVSVTLSKTVTLYVDDYKVEEDEDGNTLYDFSSCNGIKEVEEQIHLPQNLAIYTERMFDHNLQLKAAGMPKYLKKAVKDCKGWNVDDMEVIIED